MQLIDWNILYQMDFGATEKIWGLKEVREVYKNIEVQENEEGMPELGFKDLEIAEKFVHAMSILSSA